MDAAALTDALRDDFAHTLPHLPPEQQAEGARLVTGALLRAVSALRDFAEPVTRLLLFDVYGEVRRRGEEHGLILDRLGELKALLWEWRRSGLVDLPDTEILLGALLPGSRLPLPRNALFTGREAQLEQLAQALLPAPRPEDLRGLPDLGGLSDDDSASGESAAAPPPFNAPAVLVTQAVTGMGGVGKTQLAVEFAYRYGYRFAGVHWLDLRDPDLFDEQVAACGEAMRLPRLPDEDLPAYAARVLAAWKAAGPRLLLLDNLEDPAAARRILPRLHHPNLRLLLTARRARWPRDLGLRPLPLKTFTPEEARAWFDS